MPRHAKHSQFEGGPMKIAQVAPLMEAVPPKLYGGTERIVAYIADELAGMGHDVTLFASGDSETKARLEAAWPRALRLDDRMRDYIAPHIVMLEAVARRAEEFDVIHLHVDYLGYPCHAAHRHAVPGDLARPARFAGIAAALRGVRQCPGRIDLELPTRALAASQLRGNGASRAAPGLLVPGFGSGGYLAFIGRISPEKAPDAAIRIAAAPA